MTEKQRDNLHWLRRSGFGNLLTLAVDIPVRVMDCTGSAAVSTVVAGIEWVQQNAVYPAVALMSLGTAASVPLDTAVKSLTDANITVVVAAGNNDEGAANLSMQTHHYWDILAGSGRKLVPFPAGSLADASRLIK